MARKRELQQDFERARSEAIHVEPIAPIADHFSKASAQYQGAVGCLTVGAFVRAWRVVRRDRRARRTRAPRVARNGRYTPPSDE